MNVKEIVDARARLGRDDALRLAKEASTIIIAKGKKIHTFRMKEDRPDDDTLLSNMLGPTGRLRAPTLRRGRTLWVGFHEETYRSLV